MSARSQRVSSTRTCHVFGCIEGSHRWAGEEKDALCCAMTILAPGPQPAVWGVSAYRDEESGIWAAYCEDPELGTLEGAAGLVSLERLMTAYRAVQSHCDVLNEVTCLRERGQDRMAEVIGGTRE